MKRVGIITLFNNTFNHGALLQTYALQKTVEKLGFECEVIRFDYKTKQAELTNKSYSNAEQMQAFSETIPHSSKIYNSATIYECNELYDIFICGSDQIWSDKVGMSSCALPHMALSFANEDKLKIGYAVSMGGAYTTDNIKNVLKEPAQKLDYILAREKSAVPFISELSGKSVESVLDPTLLLLKKDWATLKIETNDAPYIFCYMLDLPSNLKKCINELSQKTNYEIKYLSDYSDPIEFITLIANAEYVVTNSFHGTIFSIIYNKQFISFYIDNIQSDYSKNVRIKDLLKMFDICDRYIDIDTPIENCLSIIDNKINYSKVNAILELEREKSLAFLEKSLNAEKDYKFDIVPRSECYNCSTCKVVCPLSCIEIVKDDLGFGFPKINHDVCNKCMLCKKVCPAINSKSKNQEPSFVYITTHIDKNERLKSASGGTFFAIAQYIISNGGIVFGAIYDKDFKVKHIGVNNLAGLELLRSSKYVQSDIENTYKETKQYLDNNKIVLYSGTPCQIAGLKNYLQKDYDNLYTVDLICYGEASPNLFAKYIDFYTQKYGKIININMRNKELGYTSAYKLTFENNRSVLLYGKDDFFSKLWYSFCKNRCYSCGFKSDNSFADITLGDLWGARNYSDIIEDGRGINLVIDRTSKGSMLLENAQIDLKSAENYDTDKYNYTLNTSISHSKVDAYLRSIFKDSSIDKLFYELQMLVSKMNSETQYETAMMLGKLANEYEALMNSKKNKI
ncbi:hypothetical protein AN640_00760 [Candidatus Epulonipiscium fishelsonii]|uniref:Uncharacterized protein n=1 Tax=Candidatus Epulonipiscium fishelsonii TaxID=77094 RepID=A0ACC8XJ95_9FIRM|nr:hypothetical protein AN640_00760 [Epulopiscium sp. SCG-D08WGA-EpuloA1]